MTQDDQRPDLDAALDAVIPSLTAVDDATAADSLRRTRIALADSRRAADSASAWRWGLAAAGAAAIVIVAGAMAWQWRTPSAPQIVNAPRTPAPVAPAPATPIAPAPPDRVAKATPLPRATPHLVSPVRSTTVVAEAPSPKPDPLLALVRAVQQIPEDAWTRATKAADAPVTIDPIVVVPLETPPLPDLSAEPAPGEP